MTLSIERARSRKPITWLTLLGILMLPVVIGGILVAALYNPTERLESMTAAIVNLDEPVTIDGQYTPIGRQLASGLVDGSDELDSNLTWVISNPDDAAEGLSDGTYQAVITIPEEFSAASTSAGEALSDGGDTPTQAVITVTTPSDGRVADDLITGQIASVAASRLGSLLSEATLENVFVGFTTLGEQLADAASGAATLASGATDAAAGAAAIPEGATRLSDGGFELAAGATQLGSGLSTLSAKTRDAGSGASALAAGLLGGADSLGQSGLVPAELNAAAQGAAQATAGVSAGIQGLAAQLDGLIAACDPATTPALCAQAQSAAGTAAALIDPASDAARAAGGTHQGLGALNAQATETLAGQLRGAGEGAAALSAGLGQLADGIGQSAAGARELSAGAGALGSGARELSSGASGLGAGLDQLASGTGELASGLDTAAGALPALSDDESKSVAAVIADPVTTNASTTAVFGPTAIPLLVAVVLWFGALASFIAVRAYPERTLTSRRASLALALRAFLPAALIGVGQGVLLAVIVQFVADYDTAQWWAFAGTAALAAVVFAAVNQALVALLGGIGRWVSALVGVLAVATGVISTVPGWLAGLGGSLPTAPAFTGLIAANGGAVVGLLVWGVLALVATTLAVSRRRTTSARAILAGA